MCLTTGTAASVRPENNITYSTGNEGQNICVDFSETALLQRYTASSPEQLETAHERYNSACVFTDSCTRGAESYRVHSLPGIDGIPPEAYKVSTSYNII